MLTRHQLKTLRFIQSEIARTGGIAPSRSEIAAHLGVRTKSGVNRTIEALVERGFLRVLANRARAIEVLRPPMFAVRWFVWDDESQKLVPASDNRRNVA